MVYFQLLIFDNQDWASDQTELVRVLSVPVSGQCIDRPCKSLYRMSTSKYSVEHAFLVDHGNSDTSLK